MIHPLWAWVLGFMVGGFTLFYGCDQWKGEKSPGAILLIVLGLVVIAQGFYLNLPE